MLREGEKLGVGPSLPPEVDTTLDTPERVHGQYDRITQYSHEFVHMSQIRGERNPVSAELKESILERGLLNSIDVAHVDEQTLSDYIAFVNRIWGSNSKIEDFDAQRRPDGTYYLVIAGHSRLQAICELEAEGRLPSFPIEAKVHKVSSPDQIIQIQADENIHSQPPRERRAIALVETYEWGLETGRWASQTDYLRQQNLVGKTVLSEALAFANLPPHLRNFVFARRMSYNAGIELGKSVEALRAHTLFKLGLAEAAMTPARKEKVDQLLLEKLTVEANNILVKRLNSTAAEKRIRSWRETMQREMSLGDEADDAVSLFEFDLKTPDELLDEALAAERARISEYLKQYGKKPADAALEVIQLHAGIVPEKMIQEAMVDFARSSRKAIEVVGGSALVAVDGSFEFDFEEDEAVV